MSAFRQQGCFLLLALRHWHRRRPFQLEDSSFGRRSRTRGKGLLELLGLLGVLEHQGVEVLLAADLELDVLGLGVLLDARGCREMLEFHFQIHETISSPWQKSISSLRNVDILPSGVLQKRTRSVLAAADLDELATQPKSAN